LGRLARADVEARASLDIVVGGRRSVYAGASPGDLSLGLGPDRLSKFGPPTGGKQL
jgi:hypothetical protein